MDVLNVFPDLFPPFMFYRTSNGVEAGGSGNSDEGEGGEEKGRHPVQAQANRVSSCRKWLPIIRLQYQHSANTKAVLQQLNYLFSLVRRSAPSAKWKMHLNIPGLLKRAKSKKEQGEKRSSSQVMKNVFNPVNMNGGLRNIL